MKQLETKLYFGITSLFFLTTLFFPPSFKPSCTVGISLPLPSVAPPTFISYILVFVLLPHHIIIISESSATTLKSKTPIEVIIKTINLFIHPVFIVINITNFVKITLNIKKSQYNTWFELFKIHAPAYEVLYHIIHLSNIDVTSSSPPLKETNSDLWKCFDVIVLQWIYGIIFTDLLHTIIERDFTTQLAYEHLFKNLFDNKNNCALYLEQEFSYVIME